MANLCGRLLLNVTRKPATMAPIARYCKMMNDPIEHATGLEKKELLALAAGNDDPYHMKAIKRGPSTKENPTMIPSAFDARIIGCVCHEDQTYVLWMWLHAGIPKRCECGHWFKLYHVDPLV